MGKTTVYAYLARAEAAGVGWPLPDGLDEHALDAKLFPPPGAELAARRPVPEWREVHREMKRGHQSRSPAVAGVGRPVGGARRGRHRLAAADRRGTAVLGAPRGDDDQPQNERRSVVLRRWMPGTEAWTAWAASAVTAEAAILHALESTAIPAPRVLAVTDGTETGGVPSVLMTRAPGRIHLVSAQAREWVRQMATMLAEIHGAAIAAPPWEPWVDPDTREVWRWAPTPEVWRSAIDAAQDADDVVRTFIHRDYQHFNLLWRDEGLSSVVDWVFASTGPPDIDVGHCRLNLAVLFSPPLAEQFREDYEATAGRTVDPRWDVTAPAPAV